MDFESRIISLSELLYNRVNHTQTALTASLASWILCYYNDQDQWSSPEEYAMLESSVDTLLKTYCDENSPLEYKNIIDPRIQNNDTSVYRKIKSIYKIYTDYTIVKSIVNLSERVEFIDNPEEADFLFVTGFIYSSQVSFFLFITLIQRILLTS